MERSGVEWKGKREIEVEITLGDPSRGIKTGRARPHTTRSVR